MELVRKVFYLQSLVSSLNTYMDFIYIYSFIWKISITFILQKFV